MVPEDPLEGAAPSAPEPTGEEPVASAPEVAEDADDSAAAVRLYHLKTNLGSTLLNCFNHR